MGCLLFCAAGASSEKKCRLTIGGGSSALRWTTAMAEFVFGWVGTAEALRCQPGVADVPRIADVMGE